MNIYKDSQGEKILTMLIETLKGGKKDVTWIHVKQERKMIPEFSTCLFPNQLCWPLENCDSFSPNQNDYITQLSKANKDELAIKVLQTRKIFSRDLSMLDCDLTPKSGARS